MEGLLSFILFGLFFYFMMRFGCGAHMVHGHGGHGRSHGGGKDTKSVDMVCGMEVKADEGYGKMYEGKLYRFCSRRCLDKFEADPLGYITGEGERK